MNYVKKILREDPKALIIFLPSTKFSIIRSTYKKIFEYFNARFFDTSKLDLSFLEEDFLPSSISREKKEGYLKDFHDHRRRLVQLRSILNRVCVVATNESVKLRAQGKGLPQIKYPFKFFQENFVDDPERLRNQLKVAEHYNPDSVKTDSRRKNFDQLVSESGKDSDSFYKPDHLLPLSFVLKLHSMDELEKKGVNFEFVYDRVKRKDFEDDRREVFNTRKFQERFEENAEYKESTTEWRFFGNDLDFEDLALEEHSIQRILQREREESGEIREITKNAKIGGRKMIYPLLGAWPPTNALVYKGRSRSVQYF